MPLRRHRLRSGNNNKIDFKEIKWEGVNWTHLAQDRDRRWAVVNTIMNDRVQ
jgi:hypothetical protein